MYFRLDQKVPVLQVDDTFAHLTDVNANGDLEFEFTYSVSQQAAVKLAATRVSVTVLTRSVGQKPLLGSTKRGVVDTSSLVSNIRSAVPDAKSTEQQRNKYEIAGRNSDISAFINNDAIGQLRSGVSLRSIQSFNRPRLKLVSAASVKQDNDTQPILSRIANSAAVADVQQATSASISADPRALMHDMIVRQGIDPSSVVELTDRSVSESESHGGLSNTIRANELPTDPSSKLLNMHLFSSQLSVPPSTTDDVADSDMIHVLQTTLVDVVTVPITVVIPAKGLKLEGSTTMQVFIRFELIDSASNVSINTVTKTLDVSKHLQVFYTPKKAPALKATRSDVSTRVNLEIKQTDPGAFGIQLYKKSIWIASSDVDDYTLIGTYDLSNDQQSLLVQVDMPLQSPVIYRAVPRGKQLTQGFEYANTVVKPARYAPVRSVALTATQADTGIKLEARNIPTNVVAIRFLSWNLTTFDSSPTTVNADVGFVDDVARQSDLVTTIDTDVAADNVYRYVARLIYDNGDTEDFGDATIEFVKPAPGQVDTKVSGLTVTHDGSPNVTFLIETVTVDTDIDAVKNMLGNQDLQQFFQGDLQAQRDELKQLIAHRVDRVDTSTGKRESFGTVTVPQFDDAALRKNQSIDPLVYGHRYRYEIYPLLRAPETMFDSFQKQSIDAVTKKPYTFFPAKFLHPLTLNRGVVVTAEGARQRYAKDPMAFGVIGSLAAVDVSFDDASASVNAATATRFDRYLNVITWKVVGDINQIDHFLIMKQVNGTRSVVGKAHSEFQYGSCQYVHAVGPNDIGSLIYVIVPVMNDYKVGPSVSTNAVLVEAT